MPRWACSRRNRRSELKQAGLDYYNHNVDTSPEFYGEIITTRTYQDRLDTLSAVRDAGINVCCGGIVGMGETTRDRASMLATLANLPQHPESVPINNLVRVPGTPLQGAAPVDPFDFVRCIAVARVVMPKASVRLSAGREVMSDELAVAVLPRGRELHLLRREAADHRQPGRGARSRAHEASRHRAPDSRRTADSAQTANLEPSTCTDRDCAHDQAHAPVRPTSACNATRQR